MSSPWTTPVHLGSPPWPSDDYNAQIADNLAFLHGGYHSLWLPSPSQDLSASGKVHSFENGAYLVPVIPRDALEVTYISYRNDSALGRIEVGLYVDDGNDNSCSQLATSGTEPIPMDGGAGPKQVALEVRRTRVEPYKKHWLVIGFTHQGATILGTDGPAATLARRAVNVMPLPTVIKWEDNPPDVSPCLAGFPFDDLSTHWENAA